MKESVVARWHLVMVVIVVGMLGCTPSVRQTPYATVPSPLAECSPFKEAAVQEIGPFNYENRLTIYQKINQLTKRLQSCPGRMLAERKVPALEPVPILAIADRDSDGLADAFIHRDTADRPSRDHGVIFDLNRDGKVDYVVFIGGFVPTRQGQIKLMAYHQIDSNKDGRIDIIVYPAVDLDGDGLFDDDVSAWLYDRNFDGRLDEGEYLGPGVQQSIPRTAQGFAIKTWGKETLLNTQKPILEGLSLVLHEINQVY